MHEVQINVDYCVCYFFSLSLVVEHFILQKRRLLPSSTHKSRLKFMKTNDLIQKHAFHRFNFPSFFIQLKLRKFKRSKNVESCSVDLRERRKKDIEYGKLSKNSSNVLHNRCFLAFVCTVHHTLYIHVYSIYIIFT